MEDFQEEITTVWSFPKRGTWATHTPEYRGNFAPQIPKNLILKYSKEGETILDPMMGAGTTLVEAKLLNRNAIGIDINRNALNLANKNLSFHSCSNPTIIIKEGDVRNLSFIEDESIDLIITHPPYLNIIRYSSNGKTPNDLSNITSPQKFCEELEKGIKEMYRVLKQNKYCAILIGDTRRSKHYVPLAFMVMQRFLKIGFALKEDIIKIQHNCQSTPYWISKAKKYGIHLIMHEHLFVFRKPEKGEDLSKIRYSLA